MYKKQFLLTSNNTFDFDWPKKKIGSLNLFVSPHLQYTSVSNKQQKIHLLGSFYSYTDPEASNQEIVNNLLSVHSIDELLESIHQYSGEYIIIFEKDDRIILFNDACSQAEVYYNTSFTTFGSQPKLLAETSMLEPHDDIEARDFYKSKIFKREHLFIGNTTHVKNINHLLPNHYIEINSKKLVRFFPLVSLQKNDLKDVANRAASMIKGYLRAVAYRQDIAVAITAGYDSRILFLASLELDAKYFVKRHPNMSYNHFDVITPLKLTSHYNKDFTVISTNGKLAKGVNIEYENSVDFPRHLFKPIDLFKNHTFVNGNISEVVRNYYGYKIKASAHNLSALNGYFNNKFIHKKYDQYLKLNNKYFENRGFHPLDMFYWEQKMSTWAAKAKTEINALGMSETTPFNSRALLCLLMSVDRKYRQPTHNILYDKIIDELSNEDTYVAKLPINSGWKNKVKYITTKTISPDLYHNIRIIRSRLLRK